MPYIVLNILILFPVYDVMFSDELPMFAWNYMEAPGVCWGYTQQKKVWNTVPFLVNLHSFVKSPFLMVKSTINGHFQ